VCVCACACERVGVCACWRARVCVGASVRACACMRVCVLVCVKLHAYFPCTFHFHYFLFNRWPDDDPIVGSKPVSLCNNKSPFFAFDGFFLYLLSCN
jgi:hypothetical protein